MGSLVSKELGVRKGGLPGCITFGGSNESGAGFLPYEYAPLIIEKVEKPLEDLVLPKGVTLKRLRERELLLRAQNKSFRKDHQEEMVDAQQKAYDRALEMIRSSHLKAFDISKEKSRLRNAYGESPFGKACLMARRLVGAGVRFVEVTLADWDTHEDNFNRTRELCGQLDPAMSTLLRDLESRGMLDDTIVLCMGEFGRTPYINGNQGRDHFSRAFFAALAGGGIQPGRVIGKTNENGTEITERPVSVSDLYSTLYKQLGIDPDKKYKSKSDRPIQILEGGKPIRELL
jgi:arylsulfatase A-like enzyme